VHPAPRPSDTQKRALAIADNKLALNAGWDEGLLAAELQSLGDLQGLVGFSEDELVRLFKGHAGLTDPDEAPEAPADPVSQRGDVWLLGAHRLLCGDATSAEDVALALLGVKPHLMVTDPPYGVGYDPTWRMPGSENLARQTYMRAPPPNENRGIGSSAWALIPGDVAYVWHAGAASSDIKVALASWLSICGSKSSGTRAVYIEPRRLFTSTSRAGMGSAKGHIGPATEADDGMGHCGERTHKAEPRNETMGRKSRSNACGGRSRTIPRPGRRFMTRSSARGRRSLRLR
jgi:hypothetical protein